MSKQSSSRMKQVLAIFMAVLFGISLTAVAASAADHGDRNDRHGGYGGHHGYQGDGYYGGYYEEPVVVEQPVEVVTTPAVVDYGYGDYYGHGGHGGHGELGEHGEHGKHGG